MGGSQSRELEVAQASVRRLTSELQRASQQLKVQQPGSGLMAAAASAVEQQLKQELLAKTQQLESTQSELSALRVQASVAGEVPKFKQQVASAKEAEMHARRAEKEKGLLVSELTTQLISSKQELEELFGKLKFAEAEKAAAVRRMKSASEEKRLLAEQQRTAEEAREMPQAEPEEPKASAIVRPVHTGLRSSQMCRLLASYLGRPPRASWPRRARRSAAAARARTLSLATWCVAAPRAVGVRLVRYARPSCCSPRAFTTPPPAQLADFGHKRLYRGSPSTLWAGTMLWERQRAFRQARLLLIASDYF